MTDKTYEDGVRDGKIATLEETTVKHNERLDSHSARLRSLERVAWIVVGVVAAFNALPSVVSAIRNFAN